MALGLGPVSRIVRVSDGSFRYDSNLIVVVGNNAGLDV